jgi:predicted phosphodiesterase/pyruvate-formate lyase-activating enzyme
MAETPLLTIDGPALVFGGPYGNLQATAAVLAQAERLGIPPSRIICTGDLVAYGGDPVATIGLVRRAGIQVVMGNCDEQLAQGAQDCGCGYPAGSACERLSSAWFAHADREVGSDARLWLAGLPRRIDLAIGGTRLAVIHGSVSRINQFVFASTAAATKRRELALAGADGVIAGHCGLPFSQTIDGRLWHNAGVVGLPAHDGTPRVWYSLLVPVAGSVQIEHCALAYDHHAAAAAMARAGLPPDYRVALARGLWPSCDVLPFREITESGIAIEPGSLLWRPPGGAAPRRRANPSLQHLWPAVARRNAPPIDAEKFKDPLRTAKGEPRARVALKGLATLWFNTGTLCNITCRNCYIESSPRNDRLAYLTVADIRPYLDEIARDRLGTPEIGFTGGEPFMNPHIFDMLEECLARGFRTLVLTNAMRPMQRHKQKLIELQARHGDRLVIRVSLDHYTAERHEDERGPGTFTPTRDGLVWLARHGFNVAVAGRTMWGEDEAAERAGYARFFAQHAIPVDAQDPGALVLFPEMDARADVPEITTACWGILGKSPDSVMCASSRMVVRRRGADRPAVLSCTLIPYDPAFEMGSTLAEAARAVPLNHPHCAKFCVLGGASCARPSGAAAEPAFSPAIAAE